MMRAGPRKTGSMGERRLDSAKSAAENASWTLPCHKQPRPARFLQLIAHPHNDLTLSRLA